MAEEDTQESPDSAPPKGFCKKCLKYFFVTNPIAVYFLLINIFLEMVAGYGAFSVYMIYLKEHLQLPEWLAKMIFHFSPFTSFIFAITGSILAETYIGKFWLIVPGDLIWMTSYTVLALSSYTPFGISLRDQLIIAIVTLVYRKLAVLSGPSVTAFPGDQYRDDQTKDRDNFYSVLYFVLNFGSLIGTFTMPRIRTDIHCLPNEENCFPAAFGVSVFVSMIATGFLYCGYPFYKLVPLEKAANFNLMKCFGHAIVQIFKRKFRHDRDHWIDLADDKYEADVVADVKGLWHTTIIYSAFPMFWCLFDQQGSAWTMMSSKLDGRTVFGQILPDQMDSWNPLLVMVLIALFNAVVYPLCAKINFLKKPLERIGYGFVVGGLSYVIGGILFLLIEKNMPNYPNLDETEIAFHNTIPCGVGIEFGDKKFSLSKYESVQYTGLSLTPADLKGTLTITEKPCVLGAVPPFPFEVNAEGGFAYSVVFFMEKNTTTVGFQQARQNRTRDFQNNAPKLRFVYIGPDVNDRELYLGSVTLTSCVPLPETLPGCSGSDCPEYFVRSNSMNYVTTICYHNKTKTTCSCDSPIDTHVFYRGGIYDVIIIEDNSQHSIVQVFATAEPDSVPILLQVIMYFFLTAGEVMCSITGYSFAYSESPPTTKTWLQAAFYVSTSFGNLIILIVDIIIMFIDSVAYPKDVLRPQETPKGSTVFFVYASLMVINVIYFIFLARRYKYVNPDYQALK